MYSTLRKDSDKRLKRNINDIDESMPSAGWDKVSFMGASVTIPRPALSYNKNGWYGPDRPNLATKEWGDAMLSAMADYTAKFIEAFEHVALPKADKEEESAYADKHRFRRR